VGGLSSEPLFFASGESATRPGDSVSGTIGAEAVFSSSRSRGMVVVEGWVQPYDDDR
jgi:hypothetical protein